MLEYLDRLQRRVLQEDRYSEAVCWRGQAGILVAQAESFCRQTVAAPAAAPTRGPIRPSDCTALGITAKPEWENQSRLLFPSATQPNLRSFAVEGLLQVEHRLEVVHKESNSAIRKENASKKFEAHAQPTCGTGHYGAGTTARALRRSHYGAGSLGRRDSMARDVFVNNVFL